MALSTADRQQIYSRLAPVIGEQEAESLLDQFPSNADAELVTVARLAETDHRIDLLDTKIDMVELRLNAKIEGVETRLDAKIEGVETRLDAKIDGLGERLEKLLYKQMRTQTIVMITTIVAVLGLVSRTSLFG